MIAPIQNGDVKGYLSLFLHGIQYYGSKKLERFYDCLHNEYYYTVISIYVYP